MNDGQQEHWDNVYGTRRYSEVSWYQDEPSVSLEFLEATGIATSDSIIDVGGGASTLVDRLIERGYENVSVLDISDTALDQARERLGDAADGVTWIIDDVTQFLPPQTYHAWHDRAVLHFLVDESSRARYMDGLKRALSPGGHLVLATFGPDGPTRCSGLPVRRYTVDMLRDLLGPTFELCSHRMDSHRTPAGATQEFLYTRWVRRG